MGKLGVLVLGIMFLSSQLFAGEKLYFQGRAIDGLREKNVVLLSALKQSSIREQSAKINSLDAYKVIQFSAPLSEAELASLSAQVKVLHYIPDDGYVIKGDAAQVLNVSKMNKLKLVMDYSPQLKVNSSLKLKSVFDLNLHKHMSVHFFENENRSELLGKIEATGATIIVPGENSVQVFANGEQLERIAKISGVEWIESKRQMEIHNVKAVNDFLANARPSDAEAGGGAKGLRGDYTDLTGMETGTKIMNFDVAWSRQSTGAGQIVAAADTGLDKGDLASLPGDFRNFKHGIARGLESKSWADPIGHGTHVLGAVGGRGDLSGGLIRGGAFDAELIMQGLWSDAYGTITVPDELGELFDEAYQLGARIHTNSWGDPYSRGEYDTAASQVDKFMWKNPDMLILFSAGNNGTDSNKDGRIDEGSVTSPSTAKNTLTVGASENEVFRGGIQQKLGEMGSLTYKPWAVEPLASDTFSNNRKGIAAFSSRGPTRDQRLKPDVVAPGTNTLSNCSHETGSGELWGRYNKDYCFSGGTSMSAPLTAAAAAVLRSKLVKNPKFPQPSAALIKGMLMHTAEDLYPGQYGEIGEAEGQELLKPGPNVNQGYGRVDIGRAVTQRTLLVDDKSGLKTGEAKYYEVATGVKKVTLVYTDYPGAPMASRTLVNDLDLEVQVGQAVYKSESRVNNSEQVVFDVKQEGPVKITVRAKNVPYQAGGKQPFALVITSSAGK